MTTTLSAQDWGWGIALPSISGTRVSWGQLNTQPNGLTVSVKVGRRSWGGELVPWEQLGVGNILWVEPVRFAGDTTRSRVVFSDHSTTVVDQCAVDIFPVGCSPYDFWRTWIDAVKTHWPGDHRVWNSAIRVSSAASGCRESIVVNGSVIRRYRTGTLPGMPSWVRLDLWNGDKIQTCFAEWQLLGSARGTWP